MNKDEPDGKTVGRLRNDLYQKFRQTGVLENIKSQLRAQIISELNLAAVLSKQSDKSRRKGGLNRQISLLQKVTDVLVAEYLLASKYTFAHSVFVPESGISEGFRTEDVYDVLRIGEGPGKNAFIHSFISRHTAEGESGKAPEQTGSCTLSLLLQSIPQWPSQPHTRDTGAQTDNDKQDHSLGHKLKQVELEFAHQLEVHSAAFPAQTFEERMSKFQREVNERSRQEVASEIARIKERELSQMRLEERAKYRTELDAKRAEFEAEYSARFAELRRREDELLEKVRAKEASVDSARFEQRQQIYKEMERLQAREAEVSKMAQLNEKTLAVGQAQLAHKEELLAARTREADTLRRNMENTVNERTLHLQQEASLLYISTVVSHVQRLQN
jgi:oral-facial-digital syndrome 1 protein